VRLTLPIFALVSLAISKARNTLAKRAYVILLLLAIIVSSIAPSLPFHAIWYSERAERFELMKEALAIINQYPDSEILVESNAVAMTLNYVSRFSLGFNWRGIESADRQARIITSVGEEQSGVVSLVLGTKVPEIDGWDVEKIIAGDKGPDLYILIGR